MAGTDLLQDASFELQVRVYVDLGAFDAFVTAYGQRKLTHPANEN